MARLMAVAVLGMMLAGALSAQNLGPAYKWDMPADQVQSFDSAQFEHGSIKIAFEKGTCAPIATEVGITGFTVVAPGHLTLKVGNDAPILEADIHGAMLRFNPADVQSIFAGENAQTGEDAGFVAMARSITMGVFRHCWHSSYDALIPPPGSVSVDFFGKQQGDVLAWDNGTEYGAYNFTTRTEIAKGNL
jgi:hypothetical protein